MQEVGVMPEGVIIGGWNYVIAAYAVLAVGLALYVASLLWRARQRDEANDAH